jgi:hypothetical protein
MLDAIRAWVVRHSADKDWRVRAPLLVVFAWLFWKHLKDAGYSSIFSGINLAFHEIGHVFFGFFGNEFLMYAGGTLMEVLVPLIATAMLARQRDTFGVSVGAFWVGTALQGVSLYVSDTRAQQMGRVSLGDYDGPDDWTFMLSRWGLIRQDEAIGAWIHGAALLVMAASLAYAVWVLKVMKEGAGAPKVGGARIVGRESRPTASPPTSAAGTEEQRFKAFLERERR